ncbi:unnamed protein product [marine sediment metagenome]|uniref:Uncharacterized protein n=1 Tax=marine sediment metagenome TaxID=412755 RepID=X1MHD8_9ZZZZ
MNINQLKNILTQMTKREDFRPLLEADVSAFLYHLLLHEGIPLSKLHSDTRVIGSKEKQRFDLAIGEISMDERSKKPAIQPELVMEVKVFPYGFTDQQNRTHFEEVLNRDLPKLGILAPGVLRIELLWDSEGYLSGNYGGRPRSNVLCEKRDKDAKGVHIAILLPQGENIAGDVILF